MLIQILAFSIFSSGTSVDRTYYMGEEKFFMVEEYDQESFGEIGNRIIACYADDDYCTSYFEGKFSRVHMGKRSSSDWQAVPRFSEIEKIKDQSWQAVAHDSTLSYYRSYETDQEFIEFVPLNIILPYYDRVSEIRLRDSAFYLVKRFTSFHSGRCLLREELVDVVDPTNEHRKRFLALEKLFLPNNR